MQHKSILQKLPEVKAQLIAHTEFLIPLDDPTKDMYQRLLCVRDDITTPRTCVGCGAVIRFNFSRKYFAKHCSNKCAQPSMLVSRTETMLTRYGHKSPLQCDHVQQKLQNTMRLKYGGHSHFTTTPEFKSKATSTLQAKYNVDKTSHIYVDAVALAESLDPELLVKLNAELTLREIASTIGVSQSLISKRFDQFGLTPVIHTMSAPQKQLSNFIEDELGLAVTCNVRGLFGDGDRREVDIFIPSLNIAIEMNGVFWHSELGGGKGRNYHLHKQLALASRGIRLIQIQDNEWYDSTAIVKSRLRVMLQRTECITKIPARRCRLAQVSYTEASAFLSHTHIQGPVVSSINYGLYFNDALVALMTFSKSRYTNAQYELLRYSSALDTVVVGGGSRLFTAFCRDVRPDSVVSYSDKRWNTGGFYTSLGFTPQNDSTPNYKYFKVGRSNVLFSRVAFQKHKQSSKLETFDLTLTEWQNMQNNGYDRIWDCGNGVYLWKANGS